MTYYILLLFVVLEVILLKCIGIFTPGFSPHFGTFFLWKRLKNVVAMAIFEINVFAIFCYNKSIK